MSNARNFYSYNIQKYRKLAGLTQQQVADKLGIKRGTYAYWEISVYPSEELLIELSKLFDIDLEDLKDNQEFQELAHLKENAKLKEGGPLYERITKATVGDSVSFVTHSVIRMEAALRVMLRAQAEILSAQRKEPITKILDELVKAVDDEILKSVSSKKQGIE